jgi:hypothetical protein
VVSWSEPWKKVKKASPYPCRGRQIYLIIYISRVYQFLFARIASSCSTHKNNSFAKLLL